MKNSVKKTIMTNIVTLSCFVLIIVPLGQNVRASEKSQSSSIIRSEEKSNSDLKNANEPNDLWWSKWDSVIKDPNDPNEMLEAKWNAIVKVLQSKDIDQELKNKIIDKIVTPIFDTDLMAMLVLGRTNWPKLTSEQQKKFTELFSERIKNFYLEKTTLYNDQKVFFKPATYNRSSIYIPMVLISDNKEISILYKLHKMNDAEKKGMKEYWKIYDVEIEGVSVLLTYQSQFDEILRKGTVKDLLDQLEKPSAE